MLGYDIQNFKKMRRWNQKLKKRTVNPLVDVFISDIIKVCKKHKLSLSHEDLYGAFVIERYHKIYSKWLMTASDAT